MAWEGIGTIEEALGKEFSIDDKGNVGPAPFCNIRHVLRESNRLLKDNISDLQPLYSKRDANAERCGRTTGPSEKLEVSGSGMKAFEVKPQANYVSLLVDGTEVARLDP